MSELRSRQKEIKLYMGALGLSMVALSHFKPQIQEARAYILSEAFGIRAEAKTPVAAKTDLSVVQASSTPASSVQP